MHGAIVGLICVGVVVVVEYIGYSGNRSQNIFLRVQISDCYDKITVVKNRKLS